MLDSEQMEQNAVIMIGMSDSGAAFKGIGFEMCRVVGRELLQRKIMGTVGLVMR